MDLNRLLPALVGAVLALAALAVVGFFALRWTDSPRTRLWIRRVLIVLVVAALGGPVLYWFATWAVEGTPRHVIDRSMQHKQQDELHKRVQQGGH
ncbi:MAG: hypothetical protein JO261_05315 [Alphaproteobacteria bacterium]|nr:hypothetical protein [Alphaproteobacteria bacterium]MBV9693100.1 hypothetical protein [Alphaproteobacteria bacterium]